MSSIRDELLELAYRANLGGDPVILEAIEIAADTNDPQLINSLRELLLAEAAFANVEDDPFIPGPGTLPPGDVLIGMTHGGGSFGRCALPVAEFCRHVLIAGTHGSGKTFLMKSVAIQLIDLGASVWILDVEDQFDDLASLFGPDQLLVLDLADWRRNPLEVLPGERPVDVISRIKEISFDHWLRAGSLNLTDQVLKELFEECGGEGPTFADYYDKLARMSFRASSRSAGYLETVVNRMTGLLNHLGETFNCTRGFDLQRLMQTSLVLRPGRLDTDVLRFFVNDLLGAVAAIRDLSPAVRDLPLVVAMDEASLCIPPRTYRSSEDREPYICSMARRMRKRGVGLILADQVPSQIPDAVIGNMATRIVMQLVNGACKQAIAHSMGLNHLQEDYLSELALRRAVIQYSGAPRPFLAEIPELTLPPALGEQELRRRMEPKLQELYATVRTRQAPPQAGGQEDRRSRGYPVPGQPPLPKEAVDYLEDVFRRPFVMATRRDAELGLSTWKGNDLREQLLARQLVIKQQVNTGRKGGVITLLEVTEAGREFLASVGVKGQEPPGKGGFEHRYWQHAIVKWLMREHPECQPEVEHFGFGKAVDVGVNLGGQWIAIEVGITAVGKELGNATSDLGAGYSAVWVTCLRKRDRDELEKMAQRELGEEELDRVQFRLLSEFLESS
jgi:hypothetical protein